MSPGQRQAALPLLRSGLSAPTFLIEYDNTQNDANHVHCVWREFEGDWGRDMLAEHYRTAPHHAGTRRGDPHGQQSHRPAVTR